MACGTSAGYQTHTRRGTPPCPPCRAAWRDYMAALRATNTAVRVADRQRNAERREALETLRERHQAEFDRILAAIRSTEGAADGRA